jgi:predicted alpha/beta superfamily hydrolase
MTVTAQPQLRTLHFEITTLRPLPAGEQVFISGNRAGLGGWRPDGLPLTRVDDNLWTGAVVLPETEAVEFKVTRGSWETERALADGSIPGNVVAGPGGDETVRVQVVDWRDHRTGPAPLIVGNYQVHDNVPSNFLRLPRRVIVWLPPSYASDPSRRYPVLYMQDGQQVFDPQTSTFNHDWQVDEWCTQLIAEGRLPEIIVVAAYCTEDRFIEYNPSALGPAYASFVVDELKPFIDRTYRTRPGADATAIAGSSLGATMALYLAWTRPDVFFGAACLSPALRLFDDHYCLDLIKKTESQPALRLFVYCGEGDDIERHLMTGARELVKLLQKAGFRSGQDLLFVEDPDGQHSEWTWSRHTDRWLLYLFGR